MSPADPDVTRPRVGIVGAARTRQGLGPYLARWFERGGAHVAGVSGRSEPGARDAARALARELGHEVRAHPSARALAEQVDLLVVACPVEGHLAGLDAALEAGVACLCEKPLVPWRDADAGLARVAEFRRRGLLLAENCQWPFALSALKALRPDLLGGGLRSLEMRLSPAQSGAAMVEDSLSHVLSVLQALVALPADAQVDRVRQADRGVDATDNVVRFRVAGGAHRVDVTLHLRVCPEQPRPAWFAVDGVRFERRIGAGYEISFALDDGRVTKVEDPLAALVYGLLDPSLPHDRARTQPLADALALRLRLYAGVLGELADG